jgi:hypothetical protein
LLRNLRLQRGTRLLSAIMIAELLAALFFVATASGGGIPLLREGRDQAQRSLTNSTSHVDDAARQLEVNSTEYLDLFATHASSHRFSKVMIIVHFTCTCSRSICTIVQAAHCYSSATCLVASCSKREGPAAARDSSALTLTVQAFTAVTHLV